MTLKYRKDYVAPHYRLPKTDLDFTLDPTKTRVKARLIFEDVDTSKDLFLNGQNLKLIDIQWDGKPLHNQEYELNEKGLILHPTKSSFVLETTVEIDPQANTNLMGLYISNGLFCTQCEPEGFRRITYYPDHSDVMSKFTVTIHADRKKYPVLLSNGNKIKDDGDTVVWEDPFKKPGYLFALVAGDLDYISDSFITMSGKKVDLRLYCERGKGDRLRYAMDSLKKAMAWDEKTFALEYDLDLFNIVAVSHFNAGAMENKSLNIFNDAALLASPDTATDANYEGIEETVAHEYFHNYSGDRVTLRDWFELSLKEGFTVFRHQEFACDMNSRPVRRIDYVNFLKNYQFQEDDGPLAHPVRPQSFEEIENFYTVTIYEKGAELIRMQQALLGHDVFKKACDLYFKRYDGQAVTIDEFISAMEDASGKDLSAFKRWYEIPGRPVVTVKTNYDEKSKKYIVNLSQHINTSDLPFVIPLRYGLVGSDGTDLKSGTLVLERPMQEFVFDNVLEKPVLSINRSFTSPVDLVIDYTDDERRHLMTYDADLFNRYEVGHQYALDTLTAMVKNHVDRPDESILHMQGAYLKQPGLDKAFLARALVLPSEDEMADKMDVIDIEGIHRVRQMMRHHFANRHVDDLLKLYQDNQTNAAYSPDAASMARRSIKNVALGYLALTDQADLVYRQYESADNLTDRMAALAALVYNGLPQAQTALADFEKLYENEDLVLNKWFAVQAMSPVPDVLKQVQKLMLHPKFDLKNPNKVRALIGAFSRNFTGFNAADGSGYEFFGEQALAVDQINPNLGARLLTIFSKYKKLDENRRTRVEQVLKRLSVSGRLSSIAQETVNRML